MKTGRFGVVDVGSNGIRVGVASFGSRCMPKYFYTARAQVRLGADTFSKGRISSKLEKKLVKTFKKFNAIFKKYRVSSVRAVATSALRDAANGTEVLKDVLSKSAIELELISGLEEARLIHLAVMQLIKLRGKNALVMDIGGGSVEVIFSKSQHIKHLSTLPLGSVRLLKLKKGKAKSSDYSREVRKHFKKLPRKKGFFNSSSSRVAIGTGGNMRRMGKLRKILFGQNNTDEIYLDELRDMSEILFSMSYQDRVEVLGMTPDRADVILPSVILAIEFLEHFKLDKFLIPEVSLKDGVLIDLCRKI